MGATTRQWSGRRFGRWTVLSYAGGAKWKCRCECGRTQNVLAWNLVIGHTKQCNVCRQKKWKKHGHAGTPYKKLPSLTYSTWCGMKARCLNPSCVNYSLYGGRGIKVCKRWLDFQNFLSDMGQKPKGMTLERKNTNGNYSPSNCKWDTQLKQCNNKRNNRLITINGKTKTLAQWCRFYKIGYACALRRLSQGIDPKEAFTAKQFEVGKNVHWLKIGSEKKSVTAWARQEGVRPGKVFLRLYNGWSNRDAVFTP